MTDASTIEPVDDPLPDRRSDRIITPVYRAEYFMVRVLFFLSKLIGVDAASAIAGKFTRALGPLIGPLSNRARDNLKQAYPNWSRAEIEAALRGVWENLGRTAAEYPHLKKFIFSEKNSRVEIINAEALSPYANSANRAIFISGHFANWEVMSMTLHAAGIDYGLVYRAANNPLVDELIIKLRGGVMTRTQIPKGHAGARAMVEILKSGKSLGMLMDQKLNTGIAVPLMGRSAMTANSAAKFSLKYNLPIIPIGIRRTNGAHFRVLVRDAIEFIPAGDPPNDAFELTKKINEALEHEIRAQPDQWLWLHRRWGKETS